MLPLTRQRGSVSDESHLSFCVCSSCLTDLATLTSGRATESETKAFMAVCIKTAKRYNLDDSRTPVFIFERLCSIIYPVSTSRGGSS